MNEIKSYIESAQNLPGWALSALFVIAVGYVLRRIKSFPNEAIPTICLLLGSILTLLLAPPAPAAYKAFQWRLVNFIIGGVIGLLAWLFHNQILKRLEDKFPFLKNMFTGGEATEAGKPEPPKTL
jgi:hypothetical protein